MKEQRKLIRWINTKVFREQDVTVTPQNWEPSCEEYVSFFRRKASDAFLLV